MNKPVILIVEDDEKNRKLCRDILQASGYQTAEARTAEEGIGLIRELAPDLVLMDIRLPGMDGLTAMQQLRDDPRTHEIPVVALTASVMLEEQKRIMAAGFRAFKPKPVKVRELLALVRGILSPQS
jgi:CheY-like chemotaxis protein